MLCQSGIRSALGFSHHPQLPLQGLVRLANIVASGYGKARVLSTRPWGMWLGCMCVGEVAAEAQL